MTILATNYLKHLSLLCTYNYVFILNNQNISIFYICMCVYCNLIGLVEKKITSLKKLNKFTKTHIQDYDKIILYFKVFFI